MDRKNRGRQGEDIAAAYYTQHGYEVLARNYTVRGGEIDIVACKNGMLVFAEVKARAAGGALQPREAVHIRKQHRLALAAQYYLAEHCPEEPPVRFDVVEVIFHANSPPVLTCIENAFTL